MANPAAVLVPFVEPDKIIRFPQPTRVSVVSPRKHRFRKKPQRRSKDFEIRFPEAGKIAFHSPARFRTWASEWVRRFVEASFSLPEVVEVEVDTFTETATLRYSGSVVPAELLKKVARLYRGDLTPELRTSFPAAVFGSIPKSVPRLRTFRHGEVISTWELRRETADSVRLRNALVLNKPHLVQRLERGLLGLAGVEYFKFQSLTSTLTIEFNPQVIRRPGIVSQLDAALAQSPGKTRPKKRDHAFAVATVSLAFSAWATFVVPPLRPLAMALMLYTAIPTFRRARRVLRRERRLGVDVLDSIIFVACSLTGQVSPGP